MFNLFSSKNIIKPKCYHSNLKLLKKYDYYVEFQCTNCGEVFHGTKRFPCENFTELNLRCIEHYVCCIKNGPFPENDDEYTRCYHNMKIDSFYEKFYSEGKLYYSSDNFKEGDLISRGMKKVAIFKCSKCGLIVDELENLIQA